MHRKLFKGQEIAHEMPYYIQYTGIKDKSTISTDRS